MASSMEEAASQLEREHVHSVYQRIAPHFNDSRYKAWPKVKHFLMEQEPGSIVADIGCGNGKYLHINEEIFKLGCDVCRPLVDSAWSHGHEVQQCDGLRLPYRDACFDAVLSIAVIHHMSTKERRIRAIKEMARTLRVGGRIMIYVWAMEQKRRKFEKQDIFVPWNPNPPSSPALGASGDASSDKHRKVKSTSCVVDDPSQQKQLKLWFFSRSLDSVLDFSLLSRSSSNPEAIESKAQRTSSKGLIRQMSSLFSARTSLEEDVFTSEPYQQGHESENRIGNGMASVELVRDCSLVPLPDLVPHQEPLQNGEELDSGSIPEPSQRTDGFGLDCEQLKDSCLRYYHVFREGELMELIENHVDELHVLHTYLDHANWCVVAEKVQVWRV